MSVPAQLRYAASHEWVSTATAGVVTVGITDHAQDQLGEVVFVDLPEVGDEVEAGESCAEIESTKAVSDIYAPVSGEVVEINEALEDEPGLVNSAPYEGGWLFKVRVTAEGDLMDAKAYGATLGD